MPLPDRLKTAIARCVDQQSFLQELLYKTLNWPVERADSLEEIAYSWTAEDLRATGLEKDVVDARAWQLRRLEANQPWGIFFLEFKNKDAFLTGRGMAGALRKVLRGLVSSHRKDPGLRTWQREHLLFICTHHWTHYKFAYFRPKFGDARGSRLAMFGWSPEDRSNRTVCEFNLPALVWPEDPDKSEKWVAEWAKAFDKERLTSDFFKRFDESLEKIKGDLEESQSLSPSDAYTQAQLLLERLIFLYFLQNRGWLNQDRRFLPREFEKHVSKPEAFTYYKDFLDKVFWALSTPPGSSGGRLPGIPFLNGGLFDDDEFSQPSETRKTNPPLKVYNQTFQFVFQELLEAFNFTVTEDTPLNQEVAVDPEMLGKVFESIVLHAEQADPDATAPDKRKATGSYYTPRIVVHFICQEVLFQHLKNQLPPFDEQDGWGPKLRNLLAIDASDGLDEEELEALKKTITPAQAVEIRDQVKPLKCCDPAVGSGAFPVGLLHELVNLRRVLETAANGYVDPARREGSTWLQQTKEDIVQNCLFGVDIQQQAIEICRLRLWLSLVVDYDLGLDPFKADKTQFNRAIDGISQLPNLEMNFHRGDSLHDHISGVPVVILPDKAGRYSAEFQAIAKLGEQLHQSKRAERKKKLRLQILDKRVDLSRSILTDELKALDTDESALDTLFHDDAEPSGPKRNRIAHEREQLEEALAKIERDRKELEKLTERQYDSQFYVKLRKLEGADFDSPFNFVWYIDFPGIFGTKNGSRGGFDIIVGNPPFVTARNPKKRDLWRRRWPRVCEGTYQLVCPFTELGFSLLRNSGQLGYIVSNAFARREFGIPLVEDFLPTVRLQKVVDCSGLMFPGHGTPTCLIFANSENPSQQMETRVVGILPGGGDLRTVPEESTLWHSIAINHDSSGYSDFRIAVNDWPASDFLQWPLSFDLSSHMLRKRLELENRSKLSDHLQGTIGRVCFTGADEIYFVPQDLARRASIEPSAISRFVVGDGLRDWTHLETSCICPYDRHGDLLKELQVGRLLKYLGPWRAFLRARLSYEQTQEERGLAWWEYSIVFPDRIKGRLAISLAEIATHNHTAVIPKPFIANRANPLAELKEPKEQSAYHLVSALLNASTPLMWLKQVCFSKREAEEAEKGTYFEFAGGKVQQLPVPDKVADALRGNQNKLASSLTALSEASWQSGQSMATLALRKLFESSGEAYHDWNCQLSGYLAPHSEQGKPFDSTKALRHDYEKIQTIRERLRAEMIARQEEMDWTVYAAYGLQSEDHAAAQAELKPGPLQREQRPFVLWARAGGNYDQAVKLIPSEWQVSRKKLWEARLAAIRDNEHIRRIEQPVYKRRWDEQWKVGNQWRCGPIAYAAEFVDAFEWWLREKAEWWLEHKKNSGPTEFDEWARALWRDARVQAAWLVAAEEYAHLEYEKARDKAEENGEPAPTPAPPSPDFSSFKANFREVVNEETVPEGFQFGISYDALKKKLKKDLPGKLKKVRGKLNVPRERFHLRGKDQYVWAGLQFKE